ncbi:MAG: ABC transporter ATP-binding protein [Candidatus Omnitrophica bacterium]|nr:ABC transporter ATP-binding protein [Candidatus Omnitrophota bacterium]MDD5351798.1 ABC transporter ATP-binding protein [Candidatus Omnitrophota bacterium]MDD5550624.1 ABC transporter ATP-binding protein [Candidatus Omnitrophota bacterium]
MIFGDYFSMLRFTKPHRKVFALAVLFMMVTAIFDCVSIGMVLPLTDRIMIGKDIVFPHRLPAFAEEFIKHINNIPRWTLLSFIGYGIAILFFLKGLFTFLQTYYMSKVGQLVVRDIRNKIYSKLQDVSLEYFTKRRSGELISRITNDVRLVENAVSYGVSDLFYQSFQVVFFAIMIFVIHAKLALFSFILVPLISFPIVKVGTRLRKLSKKSQEQMADINSLLVETINGVRIVKAFSMEEYELAKFVRHNYDFFKVMMKSIKRTALLAPLTEFFGAIFGAIIFMWIGKSVIAGEFSFGVFAVFLGSLFSMIRPFKKLSQVNSINQQALAANDRIYEILDSHPSVAEKKDALILDRVRNGIVFDKVGFKYETDIILKEISLEARQGEIIAVVGSSGAGKSTLVDLIPRFYDPQDGKIMIDGQDIRNFTIKSLRANIGMVTQETILFNDSVKGNISYGRKDASMDDIIKAAKEAFAHDFIMKLSDGYDTFIGDRGVKLSGGERQRIAIARAILKNPPILILDEATSQLDAESERLVQEAINRIVKGRTVFVIGHRLSSLRNATKIIVLMSGRIAETGTHEELINSIGGVYKRLYETQVLSPT